MSAGLRAAIAGRTRRMPQPTLDLRFAIDESFEPHIGPRPTFSRASAATYVDSQGRVAWGPENLLSRSENIADAYWGKARVIVTSDATTSPRGDSTADKLIETAENGQHQFFVQPVFPHGVFTASIYFKAAERHLVELHISDNLTGGPVLRVNLSTGSTSFTNTGPTNWDDPSYDCVDVGNGWFRASVSGLRKGSGSFVVPLVRMVNNSGSDSYMGDGTSGVYVWGFQLERYDSARTYIPTTSAAVYGPRIDYDPTTLQCLGLLMEEQRTNAITNSSTSPVSLALATTSESTTEVSAPTPSSVFKILETTAHAYHRIRTVNFTPTTATNYCASCWVKANGRDTFLMKIGNESGNENSTVGEEVFFNLTAKTTSVGGMIQEYPDGWFRCSVVGTTAGTSQISLWIYLHTGGPYVGDSTKGIYFSAPQLEAGAFPTSYIPTIASQVTRSADVCGISTTDYPSVWDSAGMTMVCSYELLPGHTDSLTNRYVVSDGFNNRWIHGYQSANGTVFPWMYDGTNNSSYGVSMMKPAKLALSIEPTQIRAASPTATNTVTQNGNLLTVPDEIKFFEAASGHMRRFRLYETTSIPNGRLMGLAYL